MSQVDVTHMISFTRLPRFSRSTLKNWEEPGYEATILVPLQEVSIADSDNHTLSRGHYIGPGVKMWSRGQAAILEPVKCQANKSRTVKRSRSLARRPFY